jgi:WD40 repeat protein
VGLDRLFTGSHDRTVKLWDVVSGKGAGSVHVKSPVVSVCLHSNGFDAVACTETDDLVVVDIRTMKISRSVKCPFLINDILFNQDCSVLFVASDLATAEAYRWPQLEKMGALHGHATQVYCLDAARSNSSSSSSTSSSSSSSAAAAAKAELMASGGNDGLVNIWDLATGVSLRSVNVVETSVRALSFSRNMDMLAIAGDDPVVDVVDVNTGAIVAHTDLKAKCPALAFHPTKNNLLACAADTSFTLFSLA